MLLLTHILDIIIQQQRDPIAFLEDQRSFNRSLWWPAWLLRGGMMLVVLAILGLASRLSGQQWGEMVFYAVSILAILQGCSGFVVMIIGQVQFWLLYAYSPPTLIVALLGGLIPLLPNELELGTGIGLSFLIGALAADACTLWVHKRLDEVQRDRQRLRMGGPVSDLPALTLYEQARLARLAISAFAVLLFLWVFIRTDMAVLGCSVLLANLAGCLHLDATLLSGIRKSSLVQYDQQRGQWRLTYAGRSAMFIPLRWTRQTILLSSSPPEASAVVLALLGQGYLGSTVGRATRELPPEQVQQVILHLSLQEGGAAAIRYLKPALSPLLHPMINYCATLAAEAANPLDLQRWLVALPNPLPLKTQLATPLETELRQTLCYVREALLTFSYNTAVIDSARTHLQSLIVSLYPLAPVANSEKQLVPQLKTLPLTWPMALLFHLERHRQRLLSA